ncbi:MAG: pyridoxamine 5'-phosphate oxidase family protein, partial [Oscillospiraceae bacterium]|nr:pyridoxamine 5'-phosphate oxidase family protein [Oscillospiraceae bacterium]
MEHRPMRRKDRQLSQEEAWAILKGTDYGILAVTGDEGWPYAVPMNYFVLDGALYLHCAQEGHKLDAIAKDDRVCFTVVAQHDLIPSQITTVYKSVVVFGHASLVEEDQERLALLASLIDILGDVTPEIKAKYIQSKQAKTALVKITPQH